MFDSFDGCQPTVVEASLRSRVSIVVGATGSGKSTYVPLWLSQASTQGEKTRILCVQPRRVAAVSLAHRVGSLVGDHSFGEIVGYRIRGDSKDSGQCKILFVTCGYLRTLLACDPSFLESISHVILDEAHERSIDADFVFFALRQLLESIDRCSHIRLVVMSATIDTSIFQTYFSCLVDAPIPVTEVTRKLPHRVQEEYLEDLKGLENLSTQLEEMQLRQGPDAIETSSVLLDLVCRLITSRSKAGMATLVFLPGEGMIDAVEKRLLELVNSDYVIHILHSLVPIEDQRKALKRSLPHVKRVVLATNIAESSLTVEGVNLVIDTGFRREAVFDPVRQVRSLRTVWASKTNICQRKGRTGRVCDGTVIRLFSRELENACMTDYESPEAITANPAIVFLGARFFCERWTREEWLVERIRSTDINLAPFRILSNLLTPVNESFDWTPVLEELCELGVLSSPAREDSELTLFGSLAIWLQIEPQHSRLVFLALVLDCPIEGIVLAAAAGMEKDVFKFTSKFQPWQEKKFAERVISSVLHRVHYDAGFCSELIMVRNLVVSSLLHRARYDDSERIFAPKFYTSGLHMAELDGLKSSCLSIARGLLDWLAVSAGRDRPVGRRPVEISEKGPVVTREKIASLFESLEKGIASDKDQWLDELMRKTSKFMDMVNTRKRSDFMAAELRELFLPLNSYEEGDLLKVIITLGFSSNRILAANACFGRADGEAMTVKRTWDDQTLSAAEIVKVLTGGIEPVHAASQESKVSLVLGGFTEPEIEELAPGATETAQVCFPVSCEYSSVTCSVGIRIILAAFDKVWKVEVGAPEKSEIAKVGKPYIFNICRWHLAGSDERVYCAARNPPSWLETNAPFYEAASERISRNNDRRRNTLAPIYLTVVSRLMAGGVSGTNMLRAEGATVLPIRNKGRVAASMLLCATRLPPGASVKHDVKPDAVVLDNGIDLPIDPNFPVTQPLITAIDDFRFAIYRVLTVRQDGIDTLSSLCIDACNSAHELLNLANEVPTSLDNQITYEITGGVDRDIKSDMVRLAALKAEVDFHYSRVERVRSPRELAELVETVYNIYSHSCSNPVP
jgi:HrpA-like RNA helicase